MANIIPISDLSSPGPHVFSNLTGAQLRSKGHPAQGLFIAESAKVIGHALDAGYQPVSLLMSQRHLQGQGQELIRRCGEIPVYTASDGLLEQLTGYRLTRGILCAMRRPPLPDAAAVCAAARRVAVLEGIADPTNVGAIFRSAAALHVDAVLVTPTCCVPLHRRAVRVSMGAVFQVPWTRIGVPPDSWPEGGLALLRASGFCTAAMALREDALPIDHPRLMAVQRLAIVLGAEGDGLAPSTIAHCDLAVRIPMSHGVDSLNVAAASAVAFWQLRPPSV